jgi:predicted PurR-regulated permease PerM
MASLETNRSVSSLSSDGEAAWETATRISIIGIFIILLGVTLDLARTLLLPIISAMVLALVLGPLETATKKWGVPAWLFGLLVILLVLAALNAAIIPASVFVINWITHAPEMLAPLMAKLRPLMEPFEALRPQGGEANGVGAMTINFADLARYAVTFLTPTLGEMVIFLAALFFLLTSRDELRKFLVLFYEDQESRLRTLRILNGIETDLKRYVAVVTLINLGFGVIIGLIAQLVGLPQPALWGVLAFTLKFVPYLGPAIIFALLLGGGLATFDSPGQALVAPAVFIVLDTLESYIVTPSIVGKRLTLSPGLVFLAVAFWTWLWGPIGAFLATPLLIAASVTIAHAFPRHEADLPG